MQKESEYMYVGRSLCECGCVGVSKREREGRNEYNGSSNF